MYCEEYDFKYVPGNGGRDCPGDGRHKDAFGNLIECQCDECDFLLCCIDDDFEKDCTDCREYECKHNETPKKWPYV